MRLTAWIVIIALVVGIGGGWLLSILTGGGSSTPNSVYVTTADSGSIVTDSGTTLLTLKAVANDVSKVDTETRAGDPIDSAQFFSSWNDTFGDDARNAVIRATGPDGPVQISAELTNATFSQIGYVVQFDAKVTSGPDQLNGLTNITLIIDAD
jgi:hypothetical protein